jgi:transcriptional antiterminator RfaH
MERRFSTTGTDGELSWRLLYTKPHAESWAEVNLRKQGYIVLLPRVSTKAGFAPLFPRYLFAGVEAEQPSTSIRSTFGVQYVVQCGDRPAEVPEDVVADIRSRMDSHGVVHLEDRPKPDPLFAKRERERVRTLVKLAEAGFRVKLA